jgi:hypothetical protein
VIEHLPGKHDALSSNSSTAKDKNNNNDDDQEKRGRKIVYEVTPYTLAEDGQVNQISYGEW